MTTFTSGPAQGAHLMLKRAARFLRVTECNGKWDALDQPDDTAQPGETLFAYEITGPPSMCHIRAAGGRSGFYPIASYRYLEPQPTDADMRSNNAWGQWCEQQPKT